MSNFKHYGKRFLGTVALLLFIIVAVVWIYIFVRDPQLAGGWKEVIVPALELIFLGTIGAFFKSKFISYARETKNVSTALVRLIGEEWIIQVSIWAVILITILHIILTMPVFKVLVNVRQSNMDTFLNNIPWTFSIPNLVSGIPIRMELQSIDQPFQVFMKMEDTERLYSLEQTNTSVHDFKSRRLLRWNQDASIILQIKEFVKVTVRTKPADAQVWIKRSTSDSPVLCPFNICRPEKGKIFEIRVTAEAFLDTETHSFAGLEKDTTIDVWLEPRPGFVKFNLSDLGGRPIEDMDVYIDEGKLIFRGYSSGQSISLKPDRHSVYMEKRRDNKTYYTDTHYFQIESGQTRVETCIVKTRSSPP